MKQVLHQKLSRNKCSLHKLNYNFYNYSKILMFKDEKRNIKRKIYFDNDMNKYYFEISKRRNFWRNFKRKGKVLLLLKAK